MMQFYYGKFKLNCLELWVGATNSYRNTAKLFEANTTQLDRRHF